MLQFLAGTNLGALQNREKESSLAPGRIWVAHLVALGLAGGSLFDLVTGREHWPFSPYSMYSRMDLQRTASRVMPFGAPEDSNLPDFPLQDEMYVYPFEKTRLNAALARLAPSGVRLQAAARDLLRRYQQLRRQGKHTGPKLKAVRIYRVHWDLRPDADNVHSFENRRLLVEIAAGASE